MNKYTKLILKIAVSLFFIWLIVFSVDWLEVIKNIGKINGYYLVAYISVIILGIAVSSYKWKILADFKGIKLSFVNFFKLYLTGNFINNFMPSFIGGDVYKAYSLGKPEKKYIEASSTVVMDRITGLFGAILLALIFSLLNIREVLSSHVLIVVNLIVLGSFLAIVFLLIIKKLSFWKHLKKYFPQKLIAFMIDLKTYKGNSGIIQRSIIWAFIFDFVGIALANFVLFTALGIKIGVLDYLSIIFLISIIASIPVSINNIGLKEWAYIAFFGALNLDPSAIVTVAIISRFIQMLISFFALPFYLKRDKK